MKVATKNPRHLIEDIVEKIDSTEIKSWLYKGNLFYHKGEQYINHINFTYLINDDKSIIEFRLHSDGNAFAESRGFELLEGMLLRHFKNRVEIIKNN
jgi:hypothetical protein